VKQVRDHVYYSPLPDRCPRHILILRTPQPGRTVFHPACACSYAVDLDKSLSYPELQRPRQQNEIADLKNTYILDYLSDESMLSLAPAY
jgi:hypothetical protein